MPVAANEVKWYPTALFQSTRAVRVHAISEPSSSLIAKMKLMKKIMKKLPNSNKYSTIENELIEKLLILSPAQLLNSYFSVVFQLILWGKFIVL